MIKKYINMKARPQAGDATQSATAQNQAYTSFKRVRLPF